MISKISAYFFLTILVLFAIGSLVMLTTSASIWSYPKMSMADVANGKLTHTTEKQIEKNLIYKSHATNLWASLRYSLFNTGSDGVIIGKNGWLFTNEEFELTPNVDAIVKENLAKIHSSIAKLQDYNIQTMFVWIPEKTQILSEKLQQHPPKFHHLEAPLMEHKVDGTSVFKNQNPDKVFMRTDTHWSPFGAQLIAQATKQQVQKSFPTLAFTPKAYQTKLLEKRIYNGDLIEFIPTGWFQKWIGPYGEPLNIFQTYERESESTALQNEKSLGLFDDETIDITLIGTSYSAQKEWNFEGFLKQAFQTDILNLSNEGKGPFAPMDEFLKSLEHNGATTKLVIWEFPARYLLRPSNEKMASN